MEAWTTYTTATAAWLALQSVPLLLTPSILAPLMAADESRATGLEIYLSRSLGLSNLFLAAVTLLLSGLIPIGSSISTTSSTSNRDVDATTALTTIQSTLLAPTTLLTTLLHFVSVFHAYTAYAGTSMTVYAVGVLGSSLLAAMGTWCLLFAAGKGHVSRRTGKDKRVSGWPFGDRVKGDRKVT